MAQEKTITIGSQTIVSLDGQTKKFQVVSSADVDVNHGKISYFSPIGQAILGKEEGESFEVILPNDKKVHCQIIKIKWLRFKFRI